MMEIGKTKRMKGSLSVDSNDTLCINDCIPGKRAALLSEALRLIDERME